MDPFSDVLWNFSWFISKAKRKTPRESWNTALVFNTVFLCDMASINSLFSPYFVCSRFQSERKAVMVQAAINPQCISKEGIYSPLKWLIKKTSFAWRGKSPIMWYKDKTASLAAKAWSVTALVSFLSAYLRWRQACVPAASKAMKSDKSVLKTHRFHYTEQQEQKSHPNSSLE